MLAAFVQDRGDRVTALLEEPDQLQALVSGNAAADDQQDPRHARRLAPEAVIRREAALSATFTRCAAMDIRKLGQKAGDTLLEADHATHELLQPYAKSRAIDALHPVSKLADQPALRLICGGLLFAGLVRGDRKLANAAGRMIMAHETATFAKKMVKTEIDRTRPRSAKTKAEKKPRKGNSEAKEL